MILREVLHAHIPTLTAQSTIRDAVDKMDIYQFPALVIVDDMQSPIAVITEGDVCRAVSGVGSLSGITHLKAMDYGSREPKTADVSAEISDALHEMLNSGITILPVVERGRLMGIVLRVDLMQAILTDIAESQANDSAPS